MAAGHTRLGRLCVRVCVVCGIAFNGTQSFWQAHNPGWNAVRNRAASPEIRLIFPSL